MKEVKFEDHGFFIEYIVDGKLIGTKTIDKNPDGKIGWDSTKHFICHKDIVFVNYAGKKTNKKIKLGTRYKTRIYPLCGKWKNKLR